MKKIAAITICMMLLSIFTACGSKDEENNRIDSSNEKNVNSAAIEDETTILDNNDIIENNISDLDGVYIHARDIFYNKYNRYVDFTGNAYKSFSESGFYDHNISNFLYLNNGEFNYGYNIGTNDRNRIYSGTYKISEDNQFIFNYENVFGKNFEENKKWNYSINDDPNESRAAASHIKTMQNCSDNNALTNLNTTFNPFDKLQFIHAPYCLNIYFTEDNQWSWYKTVDIDGHTYTTKVYIKNNFITTKQKGYYFDDIKSNNEFVLKYDDSEFSENPCNMTINFNKDGTYEITSCNEYGGYTGKWTLYENNLLIIHAPDNEEFKDCEYAFCLLYLDFETKEIDIPLFIKKDDIIINMDNIK